MYRIISYVIAYACIVAAATNDGFSGYVLGIPFVIFLFIDTLILLINKSPIAIIHIIFLTTSIYTAKSDRSDWKIIYPLINEKVTVLYDQNITHNQFFPYEIALLRSGQSNYTLHKGESFTIKRQIVTGHPDFGIRYIYELDNSDNLNSITMFMKNAKNLRINYNAVGEAYQKLDHSKFFIDDISLLHHDNDRWLSYNGSRLNRFNNFGILLIYIIYIPIILLFLIVSLLYLRGQYKVT